MGVGAVVAATGEGVDVDERLSDQMRSGPPWPFGSFRVRHLKCPVLASCADHVDLFYHGCSFLARARSSWKAMRAALARLPKSRNIHSSSIQRYPRAKKTVGIPPPPLLAKTGQFLDVDENIEEKIPYEERMGYGSSSAGHLLLQQQRHMLKYMRLIEHDMPNLVSEYRQSDV